MIWKPKERKLSAEEAIELAKQELAPFWFGSSPLVAGVEHEGKVTAHPLDKKFIGKGWVLVFLDPTTFAGELAIGRLLAWSKRYSAQGVGFIAVLRFPYPEIFSRASIDEAFIRHFHAVFPVAVDADGLLCKAFQATDLPKSVLVHEKKVLFSCAGPEWQNGLEEEIQKLLRATDPGLPLFSPIHSPWPTKDAQRIEFGAGKVNFKNVSNIPEEVQGDEILYTGKWEQDQHRIMTADKTAAIAFRGLSPQALLIAKAFNKTIESGLVVVELNGVVVFEEYLGPDLAPDEEGRTVAKLSTPWLYRILKNLPPKERSITLRFPTADSIKIALYGVQFGE